MPSTGISVAVGAPACVLDPHRELTVAAGREVGEAAAVG